MDAGLDLEPIPAERRTAGVLDVALLFAGANIVTTTLVTGGALGVATDSRTAVLVVGAGILVGTGPIAVLARLGPRYGLPSMVLLRSVFGRRGASGVSALLVVTNFAWIALNNVIAARSLAGLVGGRVDLWSVLVGAIAVAVALAGPRAMALFDRVAVPLMGLIGVGLTWRLFLRATEGALAQSAASVAPSLGFLSGLDLVAGYQISWSLMFADYTRYQSREAPASLAVLLGLSISSAWLMLVGARAAQLGGGADPTEMVLGLGLPVGALLVVALSTITTNFVNLYLSSLALRTLVPRAPARPTVLLVGVVGTAFGLLEPELLERYGAFMSLLGTLLLPIVAVTLVHFFLLGTSARSGSVDPQHPPELRFAALGAWLLGVATYQLCLRSLPDLGATVPTLLVAGASYALLRRLQGTTPV